MNACRQTVYILTVLLKKGTKDPAVFLDHASSLAIDQKVYGDLQSQTLPEKKIKRKRERQKLSKRF